MNEKREPPFSLDLALHVGEKAYQRAVKKTFIEVKGRRPRFYSPGWMGEVLDRYRALAWLVVLQRGEKR